MLSFTNTYSYTNSEWGDLLTAYNGVEITYDNIGNPLSYYNGSSYSFTWQGRRLVTATKGSKNMSFSYNDEGLRVSKTVNGVTTNYYYQGTLLIAEETNSNIIVYLYDENGTPVGFMYRADSYAEDVWDIYAFEKNIFGDIVAVYNADTGVKLISYTYGAWGDTVTSYHNGGSSTTATKNPYKYRGYYYDSDLAMYYLQTRYYDPAICRFINADMYVSTGQGLIDFNMFAYCKNNPIMYTDEAGEFPVVATIITIAIGIVGAIVGNKIANNVEEERRKDEALKNGIPIENVTYTMPIMERIGYIATGFGIGVALSGTAFMIGGGAFSLFISKTKAIRLLSMTGTQTFAFGAFLYDVAFIIIGPFANIEKELVEYPQPYQYTTPSIP